LADKLYLLEVERETNPAVAAILETKRSKGDERDLAAAIDKHARMERGRRGNGNGIGGAGRGARGRDRFQYSAGRPPFTNPPPTSFPVYLPTPPAPVASGSGYGPRTNMPILGNCYDCNEPGHRRGNPICKNKKM
jgi:hypothetical protein